MGRKKREFNRLRLDSGQHRRIMLVSALLGALAFLPVGLRLYSLMVTNYDYYSSLALRNQTRTTTVTADRGDIFDRNMNILATSVSVENVYLDPHELKQSKADIPEIARTLGEILGKDPAWIEEQAADIKRRYKQVGTRIDEETAGTIRDYINEKGISGIHLEPTSQRVYPYETLAAQVVGFTNASNEGCEGVEAAYNSFLAGSTGRVITTKGNNEMDMPFSYENYVSSRQGDSVILTLDATVQACLEKQLSAAIARYDVQNGAFGLVMNCKTGEILAMANLGRAGTEGTFYERENYALGRSMEPGSTFKLVQGLIGLQEGVLRPSDLHVCHEGYQAGRRRMKCHSHASPLDLRFAVATSCNAYFCYVFRDILDNPKYGNVKEGYDAWKEYVESFGFGRKLGSDFLDERDGYVPDRGWYDRQYRGSWNSLTVISLAIGQDALGCTPLQLANLAAIVANRGYYYIPHIVKKVEGRDSLDRRFYERHYTKVDPKHFEPIVEGMWRGVNVGGTSMLARLEGLDVCGKTGTAENPRGRDHSTFLSFAPKDNPKIAISVYVENGGFGASAALPIASLLEEYYLTDTIRRPALLDYVRNMTINYPAYDR